MNLIDLDLCNSTQWYNGRVRSTNVCAGYPEGKIDTCQVTPLECLLPSRHLLFESLRSTTTRALLQGPLPWPHAPAMRVGGDTDLLHLPRTSHHTESLFSHSTEAHHPTAIPEEIASFSSPENKTSQSTCTQAHVCMKPHA